MGAGEPLRAGGRLPLLFATCWAVGGFVAAYLPLAFQRKMLMGEHIPLCLLAGVGAAGLVRRFVVRPHWQPAVLALLVLATFPSNAFFLRRDINHLMHNRSETSLSPYLPEPLYGAYGWIRANLTPRHDAVLGLVWDCAPLPGATDRVVWCGHWGETPEYGKKLLAIAHFAEAATPDSDRRFFLASIPATYLLYPNDVSHLGYQDKRGGYHPFADFAHRTPPYLRPVHSNADYTVFKIMAGTHP